MPPFERGFSSSPAMLPVCGNRTLLGSFLFIIENCLFTQILSDNLALPYLRPFVSDRNGYSWHYPSFKASLLKKLLLFNLQGVEPWGI